MKLKPCPFCGGEAMIAVYNEVMDADLNTEPRYQPECLNHDCIATETGIMYLTEIKAIEAWNARTFDPTQAIKDELLEQYRTADVYSVNDCNCQQCIKIRDLEAKLKQLNTETP